MRSSHTQRNSLNPTRHQEPVEQGPGNRPGGRRCALKPIAEFVPRLLPPGHFQLVSESGSILSQTYFWDTPSPSRRPHGPSQKLQDPAGCAHQPSPASHAPSFAGPLPSWSIGAPSLIWFPHFLSPHISPNKTQACLTLSWSQLLRGPRTNNASQELTPATSL